MWYICTNIIYIIIVNFTNFLFETYVRYNNFHVFVVLFNKSFEIFNIAFINKQRNSYQRSYFIKYTQLEILY